MEAPYAAQPVTYRYMANQAVTQPRGTLAYDFPATEKWPLYCSYDDSEYSPFREDRAEDYQAHGVGLPSRASLPVSNYTTLLPSPPDGTPHSTFPYPSLQRASTSFEEHKPLRIEHENSLGVSLDTKVLSSASAELLGLPNGRKPHTPSSDGGFATKTFGIDDVKYAHNKRRRDAIKKPEVLNQRKAYFRAVSDNVGFTITDPDTITSHDKKRSYLECLEEYVQWLHEQIQLVGQKPLPLERISMYRGLKNRSLRTILVHKQDLLRDLNLQKMHGEEKFMKLQNDVRMRQTDASL
ncbi:hypothetical protein C8T65DRAFT_745736 [Cerioporus squamosus]|nr:hypothetical protein C8T65DRAFT_745736 [Cerioporus squamosus]